jgi:hypothetical protein
LASLDIAFSSGRIGNATLKPHKGKTFDPPMPSRRWLLAIFVVILLASALISCGSSNPNIGRVLTSIAVTPQTADARNFSHGQVVFTATGTFSLPPFTSPLTFTAPYSGQFIVDNPSNTTIATVVSTGTPTGTVTVQCAAATSGSVSVSATASANNGSTLVVSGSGQLTCP